VTKGTRRISRRNRSLAHIERLSSNFSERELSLEVGTKWKRFETIRSVIEGLALPHCGAAGSVNRRSPEAH
jgi:hypothetical protein